MIKKNKWLTIIIFFIQINNIYPQSPINDDVAHRRYWYYRTRMINDFMKIGKEQGDCIVFAERNTSATNNLAKVGPDQIDITNQYLIVLALEFKFLHASQQSTQETLKEIYCLLYTINRLDKEADQFWGNSSPTNDTIIPNSSANGFILREDMPRMYFDKTQKSTNNYAHYNYSVRENPNDPNPTSFTGLEEIKGLDDDNNFSNYIGFPGTTTNKDKEHLPLPHDKYYSMLVAFMFLIKYIPDSTGYVDDSGHLQYFQDSQWDIKTEVREITNRCHTYLRGNIFGNQISNWLMEYPDGVNLQGLGQPWLYSYPIATIICKISQNFPWGILCVNEQDATSTVIGKLSYDALNLNPTPTAFPVIGSEDGSVFLAYCQAGSNTPISLIPLWRTMDLNASINKVQWAELMRKVLHGDGGLVTDFKEFAYPLASAPCMGPYNFDDGIHNGGFEWSSQDRDEHQSKRGTNSASPGRYPGVDYMLLHNLYYEYLDQENISGKWTFAYNLMDNYDEQTWPVTFTTTIHHSNTPVIDTISVATFGTNSSKMPVKVFQNLKSTAKIYATASPLAPNNTIPSEVEYRAGKEIALLPGFSVQQGSKFSAYIARYLCITGRNGSDYGNGMRQSSNTPSNDYDTDPMNTSIPIYHVH